MFDSRTKRLVSALLPVLTLAFIFIQSLLPPVVSGAESGRVAAFLSSIFGETTPLGRFLITYVRKIAHFTEYGVLGLEAVWFLRVWRARVPLHLRHTAPLWGLAVGFLDETLQCFSSRGPSIADVWLDGAGYITFFALFSCLMSLVDRRKTPSTDTECE